MSIFKNRTGLGLARRAKAFLNRGASTTQPIQKTQPLRETRRALRRKLAKQEQKIAALQAMLAKRDAGDHDHGIRPENIIWVFGSGRTGSSWLTFMMGSLPDHTRWNEPLVGYLFGHLYYKRAEARQDREHFILASTYMESWVNSIRTLLLNGAAMRFPERAEKGYLVIKEPHGSMGGKATYPPLARLFWTPSSSTC